MTRPRRSSVLPDDVVVAVVVTKDRLGPLLVSLEALCAQSRPVDHLVVVDNGADPKVEEIVDALSVPTTYLPSERNLGGAGGFALGMLHALALGADWVWCADDDGRAADAGVLDTLLHAAREHDLAEVSPMVADESDPSRLAFPLRRGLRWRRSGGGCADVDLIPGYASLFNGALFRASALDVVGVPDSRLLFRGDETEIHRRLRRSGLRFGTVTNAFYLHPEGTTEFVPILGGRLSAQYPENEVKRFYTYRNRGYLLSRPGMRWMAPLEYLRFGYFFISHGNWTGLREWLRLTRARPRER